VEASVFVFAPTLKGIRLNLIRTAAQMLDQVARKTISRANWLQKIKKTWRDRLSKRAKDGPPDAEPPGDGKPASAAN
jgi:hypothetical protein